MHILVEIRFIVQADLIYTIVQIQHFIASVLNLLLDIIAVGKFVLFQIIRGICKENVSIESIQIIQQFL